MDRILSLIGLARKAGRLEIGEEPVGAACRARDARLLLLAEDAADNTSRRAQHFAEAGACVLLRIPADKAALGRAVGRSQCAMAALTDVGFAAALAEKLAALDSGQYAEAAARLALKARRAQERRAEQERHEKNVRTGKVRPRKPAEEKPLEKAPEKAPERPSEKDGAPRPHRTKQTRGQSRRSADKRARTQRFAGARPVKKGKGSGRSKSN